MSISPNINPDDLTTSLTIYSNGKIISDTINVISVDVNREVNKIGRAEIVLSINIENLPEDEDMAFDEGNTIRIECGYSRNEVVIFEGFIKEQELSMFGEGESNLRVNCAEFTHNTTKTLKNRVFNNKSDSTIINDIFEEYGFSVVMDDMPITHQNLVQYNMSDWDFLLQRVLANGMVITVNNKDINISKPVISDALLNVAFRDSILSFNAKLNENTKIETGHVSGEIVFQGNALAVPDTTIEIGGLTKKINGTAYISRVAHTLNDGNWMTTVAVGYDEEKYKYNTYIATGTNHLHKGIVRNILTNITDGYVIEVELPLFNNINNIVLAKLSGFYSGDGYGACFIPELGDEIIIGFLNDNPGEAVILGTINTAIDAVNQVKGIVTKSKLQMQFDDSNKSIILKTPGGNIIEISDENKSVKLADQNGNKIIMSDSGIVIDSSKSLILKAADNIDFTAGAAINIKAATDLKLKGITIEALADMSFSAKGNAQAELSTGGQVTIKGAMVMIN